MKPRGSRTRVRGFSLVEMMAVVTITAILATLAWVGLRRYLIRSRGSEAQAVIQAIRSAEVAYMAENHTYLNVSTEAGGLAWYPNQTPNTTRSTWVFATHPDAARWARLAAPVNRTVQFGYLVNAGTPGTLFPVPQDPTAAVPSGTQTRDWYFIQAKGDTDGDGSFGWYAGSSTSAEIYANPE